MAGNKIEMDPDMLRSTAKKVETTASDMRKELKRFQAAIEGLSSTWSSEVKDRFLQNYQIMTKALEQSGAKYSAAQKKAVTKSNQFRAHNRDFYGNPVVVTAVAGSAGAVAGATASAAAASEVSGTAPAASNVVSDTVPDVSNTVSASGESVHIKSQDTINVSSQTDSNIQSAVYTQRGHSATIAQVSEHARNTAAPKQVDNMAGTQVAETVSASTGSAGAGLVQGKAVMGMVDTAFSEQGVNGAVATATTAGAAAAGAVIGGIAGGAIGAVAGKKLPKTESRSAETIKQAKQTQQTKQLRSIPKEKKQEPSTDIEAQLEAARERLRRFNEMEMEEKK